MSGSITGKLFSVSTWGESHGKALGVVVDGCPAGISLSEEDIQKDMDLRKPGANQFGTKRSEDDAVQILSGVFEGRTTGTPISMLVFNKDQHSKDYSAIKDIYRPGHADYTFSQKYGFRDYRGGGRTSGRETLSRVAAGAVAKKILAELGITFLTYTRSIGPVESTEFNKAYIKGNPLFMADKMAYEKAADYLSECIKSGDSAGGVIQCTVTGLPPGIGEPVFDKLDAALAKAMLSLGAVKGFEMGLGFGAARVQGSQNNDSFCPDGRGGATKATNHSGGVLGGISDGSDLVFRVGFKPTPSISLPQQTVTLENKPAEIRISGRHDPVIVPRAVIVVEAMAAITIVDLLFQNMSASIENVKKIYNS